MTTPTSVRSLVAGAVVLGGRYRLVRFLGEGGMGVVWEATDLRSGTTCAVKVLRDANDRDAHGRLLREAEAVSAVNHPNVVRILAIERDERGAPAIVMELLQGESLGARLERTGPLAPGQTCAILGRVAEGIGAAHAAGLVHRDLKPDNVFLCARPDGTTDVKVLDFGIAKPMAPSASRLTVTGVLVGTPHYMSPEQAGGEREIDARTDVWALAVLAFECLTQQLPVNGDNYGQILTRLIRLEIKSLAATGVQAPQELVEAIEASLVPRTLRPDSIRHLAAVFRRHADATIAPPPLTSAPVVFATSRRATLPTFDGSASVASSPSTRGVLAALAVLAAVGVVLAGLAFRARASRTRVTAVHVSEAVTAAEHRETSVVAPPASIVRVASAVPDAGPPVHTAPRASASARTPAAGTRAPTRLQGGVAGDVPF